LFVLSYHSLFLLLFYCLNRSDPDRRRGEGGERGLRGVEHTDAGIGCGEGREEMMGSTGKEDGVYASECHGCGAEGGEHATEAARVDEDGGKAHSIWDQPWGNGASQIELAPTMRSQKRFGPVKSSAAQNESYITI
jgi:hypothetical protein